MSPRLRSVVVLVLGLVGCRSGDEVAPVSSPPSPVVGVPAVAAPSEPGSSGGSDRPGDEPGPAVADSTPSVDEAAPPEPAELRDGEFVRVAGRLVVVSSVEEEPTPEQLVADEDASSTYTLEVSVDGATEGTGRLSLPTGFQWCDNHEAVVDPVKGDPSPLIFAQAFCETGADEFSRDIRSAVIHVGDASTAPRILWQGEGRYSSSFGVCVDIDVPSVAIVRPGVVRIEQHTEVVKNADPDRLRPPCRPRKLRVRKAEIEF